MAVPFRPAVVGERAHLVRPGGVPGLGDDLGVGQERVFGDRLHDGHVRQQVAVAVAAEDRGQVEAEPVDVVVVHPVAETVEDHLADDRMVAVERVSAAAVVLVVPAAIEHVVDPVLQPLEAQRRPFFVALGRVVEDHVEDHLDARPVQGLHHLLELADLVPGPVAGGVAPVRGEQRHRIVAPVVGPPRPVAEAVEDGELVHGHELHRRYAQRLEMGNLLDHSQVGARVLHLARARLREPAHVHLVDDRLRQRPAQVAVVLPVELVVDHNALGRADQPVVGREEVARQGLRVGIDQSGPAVEAVSHLGHERSVGLEVIELSGRHGGDEDAPHVAPPVEVWIEVDDLRRLTV